MTLTQTQTQTLTNPPSHRQVPTPTLTPIPPPQSLTLTPATPKDCPRIAEIHLSAFANNTMLHAQFPTQETRHALRDSLIEKAVAEISDPFSSIMVVRDSSESSKSSDSPAKEEDEIISFAKWGLPVPVGVEYKEPEWNWPVGTEMGVLGAWSRRVEEVTAGVLGGEQEWYRLSYIATDPKYQRRGAASVLVNWALERSKRENVPIALESTMDAEPFYEKLGFRSEGCISMPVVVDGESVVYREMCLVYRPSLAV